MVRTITAREAKKEYDNGEKIFFVDVRTPGEYRSKHIKGSYNIPLDEIDKVAKDFAGVKAKLIFLCRTGNRSSRACVAVSTITNNQNVISLEGGVDELEKVGFKTVVGRGTWDIERQVRFVAGLLVMIGVILGYYINSYIYLLSLFVGGGLVFASVTNTCAMGMMLMKLPFNRTSKNVHVKATMHDILENS